jgi:hypothetical protein
MDVHKAVSDMVIAIMESEQRNIERMKEILRVPLYEIDANGEAVQVPIQYSESQG